MEGITIDIKGHNLAAQRLELNVDTLTGLPTGSSFQSELKIALQGTKNRKGKFGILFIGIDRFKPINNTFGHEVGDLLLQMVAQRMSQFLVNNGHLARFNGDEFTALIPHVQDESQLMLIAERFIQAFQSPFHIKGFEIIVSISIGASLFPACGTDGTTLMRTSYLALYIAKLRGKNQAHLYEPWMDKDTYSNFVLASEFQQALKKQEFILHYQPRINVVTKTIEGFEALIRWNHPTRGLIFPNAFIPLAEETGFILTLGQWVLDEACRQTALWRDKGALPFRMGVNVSAQQFAQIDFLGQVEQILAKHKLDPSWLEIEITESTLMQAEERNIQVLDNLNCLGVRVSIDDFGTGYSSLSYLKKFKVDTLKIDKSFIRDLPDDLITNVIIRLAHKLGMEVVAEGVERQEQLEYLMNNGCEQAQGYYIGGPSSPDRCMKYLFTQA